MVTILLIWKYIMKIEQEDTNKTLDVYLVYSRLSVNLNLFFPLLAKNRKKKNIRMDQH